MHRLAAIAFLPAARITALVLLGIAATACQVVPTGPVRPDQAVPEVEPARPPGPAPPVDCRGVPRDHCVGFSDVWWQGGDWAPEDVVRVIVTCTQVCNAQRGEVRIEVLLPGGERREAGVGGYEGAVPGP